MERQPDPKRVAALFTSGGGTQIVVPPRTVYDWLVNGDSEYLDGTFTVGLDDKEDLCTLVETCGRVDPQTGEQRTHLLAPSAARVAAKYKNKKTIKTQKGDDAVIYEYSEGQVQHRNREKAKRLDGLDKKIGDLRTQYRKDLHDE